MDREKKLQELVDKKSTITAKFKASLGDNIKKVYSSYYLRNSHTIINDIASRMFNDDKTEFSIEEQHKRNMSALDDMEGEFNKILVWFAKLTKEQKEEYNLVGIHIV